jgi:predicted aminopeptidase
VPYKGFFNAKDAAKERGNLQKKGLDVWVRGVDAFSTLGFFRDPLYSYMRKYSAHRLADLIIHELTHATIYIKSDSEFNEGLAEFIGKEGATLYIEKYYGLDSEEYRAINAGNDDNKTYIDYIKALSGELDVLYKSDISDEEKLKQKAEIIKKAQKVFSEKYDEMFTSEDYRHFSEMNVNNAYLDLYRLYNGGDDFFENLYEEYGRDIKLFVAKAKEKSFYKSVKK